MVEQVARFLGENVDELGVEVAEVQRLVRILAAGGGRLQRGQRLELARLGDRGAFGLAAFGGGAVLGGPAFRSDAFFLGATFGRDALLLGKAPASEAGAVTEPSG